jgi:hypothetical protein
MVKTIFAYVSSAAGVFGALMFLGLMLAGMPNSKPEQLRMMTRVTIAGGAVSLMCLVASIWLITVGYTGWGALIGALPLIGFIIFIIVAMLLS